VNINAASAGRQSARGELGELSRTRVILSEFKYSRGAEIYRETEPAEYIYQVVEGAVRSYKLLSDGRRQIGAFHLVGDIFGLENSSVHRFTTEAIVETTVRLMKRCSLEQPDQQRRREQLGKIGEAPGSTCSHAHGRAVVSGLVDILELHFGDRRFVLHIPGTSPGRSCGNKAHILRRSLQLGFQVQNDIVEQTSRHGIRSFSCQYSVAFHLISALVPIFAVSHGDVPML